MTKIVPNIDFCLPIKVSYQSQRQSYIFDLIFKQLIGIDYTLVDVNFSKPCLVYSSNVKKAHFVAHNYLYSNTIEQPKVENVAYKGRFFPFKVAETSFLPFDPFATCFYFVTRHEELNALDQDEHGRYLPSASWLQKNNWLQEPIVNYIAEEILIWIEIEFDLKLQKLKKYTVLPTIDIDNPYAFAGRGLSFSSSLLKSLLSLNVKELLYKVKSIVNPSVDPFNTHKKIIQLLNDTNCICTVFLLMKTKGKNAVNTQSTLRKNSIFYSNTSFQLGIHPSYKADSEAFESERLLLEKNLQRKVDCSRHHFLSIDMHKDLLSIYKQGIKHEHSMGYAKENGFRAGICQNYLWFDISTNQITDLMIHPFFFMDSTYIFHKKSTPEEALTQIKEIRDVVQKYQGDLSFIFHNESLSNYGVYKGWGSFLEKTLKELC